MKKKRNATKVLWILLAAGAAGLALLRLDRLETAAANGDSVVCGQAVLTAKQPGWANFAVTGSAGKA